jgi:hypothetical protein
MDEEASSRGQDESRGRGQCTTDEPLRLVLSTRLEGRLSGRQEDAEARQCPRPCAAGLIHRRLRRTRLAVRWGGRRHWRPPHTWRYDAVTGASETPLTYAIRGASLTSRGVWRRTVASAPDLSSGTVDAAAAAIACRAARCPSKAVRPDLVSMTCRRERDSSRTRETSTYPASASAERCLLRTESEISRLSRMPENGNDRTGESIAHIWRRNGAWISSLNADAITVATPERHDVYRKRSRRTDRTQRSQSRLHRVPSWQEPNCCGWQAARIPSPRRWLRAPR